MRIDVIDHPDADHPAHPAATVVLVRDGADELEVLMILRGLDTAFGGMWAFPGGVVEEADVVGTEPDPLPAARRAAVREAREEVGLVIDEGTLVWWSHWLPPVDSLSKKRFSTWFFVAPAHAGHDDEHLVADGAEVHDHRWIAPANALAAHERGEALIVPPTFVTLQQLVRYGDVASLLAAARADDPVHFATEIVYDGAVRCCLWHGDSGYGFGELDRDGPRHRLVMDDEHGWRYLNTM